MRPSDPAADPLAPRGPGRAPLRVDVRRWTVPRRRGRCSTFSRLEGVPATFSHVGQQSWRANADVQRAATRATRRDPTGMKPRQDAAPRRTRSSEGRVVTRVRPPWRDAARLVSPAAGYRVHRGRRGSAQACDGRWGTGAAACGKRIGRSVGAGAPRHAPGEIGNGLLRHDGRGDEAQHDVGRCSPRALRPSSRAKQRGLPSSGSGDSEGRHTCEEYFDARRRARSTSSTIRRH